MSTAHPPQNSSRVSSSHRHSLLPGGGGGGPTTSSSTGGSTSSKPPVQFSSSITLSDSAQLVGRHTIIISSESVVHPRARLDSSFGRVNIGRRCIVQERTCLGGLFDPFSDAASAAARGSRDSLAPGMSPRDSLHRSGVRDSILSTGSRDSFYGAGSLGRAVLTGDGVGMANWSKERKAKMEGTGSLMVVLGDYATVEVGAMLEPGVRVEEGATIGVGCVVGAGAEIGQYCTLAPYTVIQPGEKLPDYTVVFCGSQRRTDKRAQTQAELRHRAQARQIEVSRRMIKSDPSKFQ